MLVWQAHKARVRHMAFSPDGAELATTAGTSKFVWTWHAATGGAAGRLAGHATHARAVAYSPDGRFLASTQNAPTTHVWDRATRKIAGYLTSPGWCRESVAFRPDSSAVAVATSDGVSEWPTSAFGASARRLPATRAVGAGTSFRTVVFSPCGRYLAATRYRAFMLYDADGDPLRTFSDPQGMADAAQVAFAPDGEALAVVFGLRVHLFALPDGEETAVLRGHPNFIHAIGFMPDGRAIVSAGADGIVRTWDPGTGSQTRSFDWGIGKVQAAAVSPDGTLCAAGGDDGHLVVWDVDV